MPAMNFDKIQQLAHSRYDVFVIPLGKDADDNTIEPAVLLPYLQLDNEKRRAWDQRTLPSYSDDPGDDTDPLLEFQYGMIRMIARSPQDADRLIARINGDLAVAQEVLMQYGEATQMGEVTPS